MKKSILTTILLCVAAVTTAQDMHWFIEAEGKDVVEKRFREEAEKRIKNSLIIEKIAQDENIRVEQSDVMEHINQMAAMYGMPPVQLFEELRKVPDSFASISQQITANKVNDFLLENNKFKC